MFRLTGGLGGLTDTLAQPLEVLRDAVLNGRRRRGSASHRLFGVVDDFLDRLPTDGACGFLKATRGITLTGGQRLSSQLVKLLLELLHALSQLVLVGGQLPHLIRAFGPLLPVHRLHTRRNLTLLTREVVGATLGVFRRLLRLLGTALLKQPLRLLEPLGRLTCLRPTITAVGRSLTHRVGRVLKTTCCVSEVLPLFALTLGFAAELLELARGLLDFISQRTLAGRTRSAALLAAQPRRLFGLLQLTTRQLSQAIRDFIHFLRLTLLLRALLHLVLVGHTVQFELEEIGQLRGAPATTAASPTTTAASAALLHLEVVQLLGFLQRLQCALFSRQRFSGAQRRQR